MNKTPSILSETVPWSPALIAALAAFIQFVRVRSERRRWVDRQFGDTADERGLFMSSKALKWAILDRLIFVKFFQFAAAALLIGSVPYAIACGSASDGGLGTGGFQLTSVAGGGGAGRGDGWFTPVGGGGDSSIPTAGQGPKAGQGPTAEQGPTAGQGPIAGQWSTAGQGLTAGTDTGGGGGIILDFDGGLGDGAVQAGRGGGYTSYRRYWRRYWRSGYRW